MRFITFMAGLISIYPQLVFSQQMVGACEEQTYKSRSQELQDIVKADQDDRKTMPLPPEVIIRDQKRRMRVGEIFGEGCIKSAADFSASALVYQHGNVPEHFYQTFLWSKRAVELGDTSQKRMMGLGIDRYLVNIGQKQLFASQAYKLGEQGACWCLQPVENSFPDVKRIEYTGRSLNDSFKWVDELNKGSSCAPATECKTSLKPTPEGSIPGFW